MDVYWDEHGEPKRDKWKIVLVFGLVTVIVVAALLVALVGGA